MNANNEQGGGFLSRSKDGVLSVLGRLISIAKALYGWGRDSARHFVDDLTRRKPASISYRYLARELTNRFANHEGTALIVFSCADSLQESNEILTLIAHYLQAEIDGKVLLVDQAFSSGGVSDRFGHTGEPGLTECLFESGHSVQDYIKPTADPGVFILPAGKVTDSGKRLVKGQSVSTFMDKLNQFDFVLMQQGSITMDTRYLEFAQAADLVLLYVEEGRTLVSEFEDCKKVFRDYPVRELGLIMLESGS